MKPPRLLLVLSLLLGIATAAHAQFTWTGLGANTDVATAGNWLGGTTPPNDGSADLLLGNALNNTLKLSTAYDFNSVSLTGSDNYSITASSAQTLTLHNGLSVGTTTTSDISLSANITVNLVGAQTFDVGSGQIIVGGHITGSSPVTLLSSSASGTRVFTFNNGGTGNTYTGNTTLGNSTNYVGVSFSNSSPFGTGTVTVLGGPASSSAVQLIAHGTQTVANVFSIDGNLSLRSYDAPLNFTGPVTLAGNTTLTATSTQNPLPLPGMLVRNPIVFSGNISGAYSLTANGSGVLFLTGANTFTGGTSVGSGTSGSVVFGSAGSSPGTVLVNSAGYAGDATPGDFPSFITHINGLTSSGALGFDTLPGNATATFNDAVDLSSFSNANIRIGTATSAIYNGLITPQGLNYQFGNGGGTLYVTANLGGAHGLLMNNGNSSPLTLYLQGTNAYTGGTTATNGFVVFDAYYALPISGQLKAGGAMTNVGASYLGYTDLLSTSPTAFLSNFNYANTWGIIGFDTHAGNGTVSLNNIDLTLFNDGVFIGTITSAIIDGSTLTHTGVTNGSNAANTYRFTAGQNGVLTVTGGLSGAHAVMVGSPSGTGIYSSGTVVLSGANTYSLGTTLNAGNGAGITLAFDDNNALGSGALTVTSGNGGLAGLQAAAGGLVLPNDISLNNSGANGPHLYLTGTNSFTLAGALSSTDNTASLTLHNPSPINLTLTGDNSAFLGDINVSNGILNLFNNNAGGLGTIYLNSGSAAVAFNTPSPTLYGIKGGSGSVSIPGGTNLTFDVSDEATHDSEFGGVVSGAGSITVIAPAAPKANVLYLYGNNTYSGGTVISGPNAVMALGSNNSAGTGPVTLNAPTGGLVLNAGVTFTNNLTFTSGALAGFGTFNPAGGPITFGAGQTVVPGLGTLSKDGPVGTLTFANNITFANGGTYLWSLQDVTRTDGASLINITGNLNITASGGGFNFNVFTFDPTGQPGLANLTNGTPYSIQVLHATGSISGFSAADFTIDSSQFQNGPATIFTLSQVGNDLFLNFTPVPEPSTYALLGLGLSAVLVPALRRRRKAR